jgi:hypothetical protein
MVRPALARVIGLEAGNPIFGSLNDPLSMSRITRSGPGVAPRLETKAIGETCQPCAHTFPVEENKWFVTMDITAMSSEVKEKNKVRMNGCPLVSHYKQDSERRRVHLFPASRE